MYADNNGMLNTFQVWLGEICRPAIQAGKGRQERAW